MPGVLQVTFHSKENGDATWMDGPNSLPKCWSLPTVFLSSFPVTHQHPIILNRRVAEALGAKEGEPIEFSFRNDAGPGYDYGPNAWTRDADLFALPVTIADTGASFDAAIEIESDEAVHIFEGIGHNAHGNFLVLANGSLLKLNEQERVYQSLKTSADLRCCGMIIYVDGLTDYYNHNHGAGCGFSIYASTPLAIPKQSELMVQGYRYLGDTNNSQDAVLCGLLEALVWVFRLDFQMVWIMGSMESVFRQLLDGHYRGGSPLVKQVKHLLDRARQLRVQLKFLASDETGEALDLATRANLQQRNETWCHWSTINNQAQRNLPFGKSLARQASI